MLGCLTKKDYYFNCYKLVVIKKIGFVIKIILYFKYIYKTLINKPFKKLSNYFIYIFYVVCSKHFGYCNKTKKK